MLRLEVDERPIVADTDLQALRPEAILERVLASDAPGVTKRRTWLRALMFQSGSRHTSCFNLRCDAQSRRVLKSDLVVESSPANAPCVLAPNLLLSDFVEGRASFNKFQRVEATGSTVGRTTAQPSFQLSALQEEVFVGCVYLHGTRNATNSVAEALEKRGSIKAWEKSTCTLLRDSHARLSAGPKKRQAFLYSEDGANWMRTAGPDIWASAKYIEQVQRKLQEFVEIGSQELEHCFQGTVLRMSRVSGKGVQGILAVVAPTLVPRVSRFALLSTTQRLVCLHIVCGLTVGETSAILERSEGTIKGHLRCAYESLGIKSQAELALAYEDAFDWCPDTPRRP